MLALAAAARSTLRRERKLAAYSASPPKRPPRLVFSFLISVLRLFGSLVLSLNRWRRRLYLISLASLSGWQVAACLRREMPPVQWNDGL